MGRTLLLGLAALAQVASATTVASQTPEPDWRVEGLRSAFCVRLLLDPASEVLKELPEGYSAVPASEAKDLHVSLRGVVEGQPEFASWSPSRLCFYAADTIRTSDFVIGDRSGRKPQLFGYWTVSAAGPEGSRDVVLEMFVSSDRLIRAARLAGQVVREARLQVGKVPAEDEAGVPSNDDRFQVRVGKTTVIWDGRPARDSAAVAEPVTIGWSKRTLKGDLADGQVVLTPGHSRAMVGALKVEGKGDLAKALKASPTRFAGPSYSGGGGTVRFSK